MHHIKRAQRRTRTTEDDGGERARLFLLNRLHLPQCVDAISSVPVMACSVSFSCINLLYFVESSNQRGQVFSVSTRSWKEVEVEKLKGVMPFVAPGFSFDGAIFWIGFSCRPLTIWGNEIVVVGVTEGQTVLVLCNLHTNEFKMLATGKYSIGTVIWNYVGSLALVHDIHIEASSS
ncbi:hypothetical protein K1719_018387 [Acacia pycnantha]|nr:hypothetical protein K1719_018387 [Acacia pycnantha]